MASLPHGNLGNYPYNFPIMLDYLIIESAAISVILMNHSM